MLSFLAKQRIFLLISLRKVKKAEASSGHLVTLAFLFSVQREERAREQERRGEERRGGEGERPKGRKKSESGGGGGGGQFEFCAGKGKGTWGVMLRGSAQKRAFILSSLTLR